MNFNLGCLAFHVLVRSQRGRGNFRLGGFRREGTLYGSDRLETGLRSEVSFRVGVCFPYAAPAKHGHSCFGGDNLMAFECNGSKVPMGFAETSSGCMSIRHVSYTSAFVLCFCSFIVGVYIHTYICQCQIPLRITNRAIFHLLVLETALRRPVGDLPTSFSPYP